MDSKPPVTTIFDNPSWMLCAPKVSVFIPDAQTLFTVVQGTEEGMPALIEACLAGAWIMRERSHLSEAGRADIAEDDLIDGFGSQAD